MIPPILDPKTRSPGEREAFQRLQNDPATEGWVVLHSLDLPHHRRQLSGEIDFVILVPGKGVLCLEVKAHHKVLRKDGLWFLGDGDPDPRGPFKQASEGMHSLRSRVVVRRKTLGHVLFWSAVLFPYVRFSDTSEEWHPWQVIDADRWAAPMSDSVLRVLDEARAFVSTSRAGRWFRDDDKLPTPDQCDVIAQTLRPDFEFFESPSSRRRTRLDELKRYTDEQAEALDLMAEVERVVFEGPAGTGKTLLAIETARRESLYGKKVLLLCFNKWLGRWLKDQTRDLENVTTATYHYYLLELTGVHPPADAGSQFWEQELPSQGTDALLQRSETEGAPFDVLVVDEAQDIMQDAYLDTLELSVGGGLAAGRWRFFSDFARQSIFGTKPLSLESFLDKMQGRAAKALLRINCRNTPRIASYVAVLAGLNPDYRRILRPDDGVQPDLVFYSSEEAQQEALTAKLQEQYNDGYRGEDIVVLSTVGHGCATDVQQPPWSDRLRPYGTFQGGYIGYTTIHAFKGLEAPVVVVTDVLCIDTPEAQNLFYVGVTRAVDRLVILVSEAVRPQVVAAVTRARAS